jgi:quinol monooxygenase YgiN
MTIIAMLKMMASPKKRTELLQTLETLKNSTTKADLGCVEYRFFQEDTHENNIILIMEWQTQDRWAAYQNTEQYKILLGAINLLCESSEMKIGAVPMAVPNDVLSPLLS